MKIGGPELPQTKQKSYFIHHPKAQKKALMTKVLIGINGQSEIQLIQNSAYSWHTQGIAD